MEYRIKSTQYINRYGDEEQKEYYIEYQKPFLLYWKRWVRVKHLYCGMSDCDRITTYFKSLSQAEQFAEKHLCGGKIYDAYETLTVKQGKC